MSVRTSAQGGTGRSGCCGAEEPLAGMAALIRQLAGDPAAIAEAAGLSPEVFGPGLSKLPSDAWCRLLAAAAAATEYPALGLMAGRMWHLDCLGSFASQVTDCEDIGAALELLTERCAVHGHRLALTRYAMIAELRFDFAPPEAGAQELNDCLAAASFNLVRELVGARWLPAEVFLPRSRPPDAAPYWNLFKVFPRFDASFGALRFAADWLDRPLETAASRRQRFPVVRSAGRAALPSSVSGFRALRVVPRVLPP